jgi:hypothetical protein
MPVTLAKRGVPGLLLVSGAMLAVACNSRPQESSESPVPSRDEAGIEIGLERTACFGSCPIYRLHIAADGIVRYEGLAYVQHVGFDSASVPVTRLREVVDAADRMNFFALHDSYGESDAGCEEWFPDSPSVITSIRDGARFKRVLVDYGCTGAPAGMADVARLIDSVATSARWTGQ